EFRRSRALPWSTAGIARLAPARPLTKTLELLLALCVARLCLSQQLFQFLQLFLQCFLFLIAELPLRGAVEAFGTRFDALGGLTHLFHEVSSSLRQLAVEFRHLSSRALGFSLLSVEAFEFPILLGQRLVRRSSLAIRLRLLLLLQ